MLRKLICWLQWLEQLTTNPDTMPIPRKKHHNTIPGPHLDLCKTCWIGVDNHELSDGRCPYCHDKMEPISEVLRLMAGNEVAIPAPEQEQPLTLGQGEQNNLAILTEFRQRRVSSK